MALAVSTIGLWNQTTLLARQTDQAMRLTQRAFVFSPRHHDKIKTERVFIKGTINSYVGRAEKYFISVRWENVGIIPARGVRSQIKIKKFPANEDQDVEFIPDKTQIAAVIGPRDGMESGQVEISVDDLLSVWGHELEVIVWCRIEYVDIFDPNQLHFQEKTVRLAVIYDPTMIPTNPSIPSPIEYLVWGLQNIDG